MQNLLQNLEVLHNCIKYTFGTENWRRCNAGSKLNNTITPLDDVFNSQYRLINVSKNKIDKTITETTMLITNIDRQIETPLDISAYNTIVENYHIISNSICSIFKSVTSNLQPISNPAVLFAYPAVRVDLYLITLKQLKYNLQQLISNLEGRGNELKGGIQKLANRFDQFESPLGKIPLGFSETIAVFPLLLAIGRHDHHRGDNLKAFQLTI